MTFLRAGKSLEWPAGGRSVRRRKQREADGVASRAWYEVSNETRAHVVELARAGRRHPDVTVRTAAEGWARAVLRRRPWGLLGIAVGLLIALASSPLGDPVDAGGPVSDRNNVYRRRDARAILRADDAAQR
ncbi:MAG: hypothetical protein ACQSGP_23060 [Frankia sp.]